MILRLPRNCFLQKGFVLAIGFQYGCDAQDAQDFFMLEIQILSSAILRDTSSDLPKNNQVNFKSEAL
jgi:hypothetical protein